MVSNIHNKLAATVLALMILLSIMDMAVFLELLGPTRRARVPQIHGHRLISPAIGS